MFCSMENVANFQILTIIYFEHILVNCIPLCTCISLVSVGFGHPHSFSILHIQHPCGIGVCNIISQYHVMSFICCGLLMEHVHTGWLVAVMNESVWQGK